MTIEADVHYRGGHATLRGPPSDIAQVLLFLHQTGMGDLPAASTYSPDQQEQFGLSPKSQLLRPIEVKNLLVQLRAIPAGKVQAWVKEHPRGNASDFAREFLQCDLKYSGSTRAIYISTYNKLARARRRAGLASPTKVGVEGA